MIYVKRRAQRSLPDRSNSLLDLSLSLWPQSVMFASSLCHLVAKLLEQHSNLARFFHAMPMPNI